MAKTTHARDIWLATISVVLFASTGWATEIYSDDFDSYTDSATLHNLGGWVNPGWDVSFVVDDDAGVSDSGAIKPSSSGSNAWAHNSGIASDSWDDLRVLQADVWIDAGTAGIYDDCSTQIFLWDQTNSKTIWAQITANDSTNGDYFSWGCGSVSRESYDSNDGSSVINSLSSGWYTIGFTLDPDDETVVGWVKNASDVPLWTSTVGDISSANINYGSIDYILVRSSNQSDVDSSIVDNVVFDEAVILDGDTDLDGDVDNVDFGSLYGNFTGPNPQQGTDNSNCADLIYDPQTGEVVLDASEAAGAVITTYALENDSNDFDVTELNLYDFNDSQDASSDSHISQTDLDQDGFANTWDLGDILPTGMTLAQLESFLTTAKYCGNLGSGFHDFDLLREYGSRDWSDGDFDGDGDVDNVDFGNLYGNYTGSLAGGMDLQAIPEPLTLVLLGCGCCLVLKQRQDRRS